MTEPIEPPWRHQSVIIYRGPSVLDPSSEVVGIVTGLVASRNPKTGPIPQLWILRTDRPPSEAMRDGSDAAICGSCPLRRGPDGRVCYVRPDTTNVIYRAFTRGRYAAIDPYELPPLLRARPLRLGAYGEPVAIPPAVLAAAIGNGPALGYTHAWRRVAWRTYPWLMASVESEAEAREAHALGWRTFRTRLPGERLTSTESPCPASKEMGYRTDCERCRLCDGRRTLADISIVAHGIGMHAYQRHRARVSLPILASRYESQRDGTPRTSTTSQPPKGVLQ